MTICIVPRRLLQLREPPTWAERFYPSFIHWNELDRGGHFAAFEQPALFTQELRVCIRCLRYRGPWPPQGHYRSCRGQSRSSTHNVRRLLARPSNRLHEVNLLSTHRIEPFVVSDFA